MWYIRLIMDDERLTTMTENAHGVGNESGPEGRPNPFAALGISWEDAEAALDAARSRRGSQVNRLICICGHPVGRHAVSEVTGRTSCRPTRMDCPCQEAEPVIEAEDVRPFLHKTKGHGLDHALMLGLTALAKKGRGFTWLDDAGWPRCAMAMATAGNGSEIECGSGLLPYAVKNGRLSREPADRNVMLCVVHFEEARVAGVPS